MANRRRRQRKDTFNEYLRKLYFNPSVAGSFMGFTKFWDSVSKRNDFPKGLTKTKVKVWFKNQDMSSIFKLSRSNFPRESVFAPSMNFQFDADLADFSKLKFHNDLVTFHLVLVDIFSRKMYVQPLKSKKGPEVKRAFQEIFSGGNIPKRLHFDKGTEFYNKHVLSYLKEKDIHFFSSHTVVKASFAEIAIRYLKLRIYKFLYDQNGFRYIDNLQDIVDSYNNTIHTATGVAPSSVNAENQLQLYLKKYVPQINKRARRKQVTSYSVGDLVRLSRRKPILSRKSYFEQFTQEIFRVRYVIKSTPPRYLIEDLLSEPVIGSFYGFQLVKLSYDPNRTYKIEKIIRYRGSGRKKEALIKWSNYDKKFNSWILASQVRKYVSSKNEK